MDLRRELINKIGEINDTVRGEKSRANTLSTSNEWYDTDSKAADLPDWTRSKQLAVFNKTQFP